jgi:hypothetical protein
MKTISLKVDDALNGWLEAEARKLGRSKSALAREALEQRRKGTGGRSIHDVMKDVCGIIKGGPRDMSTNKKYMKGFGRDRRPA